MDPMSITEDKKPCCFFCVMKQRDPFLRKTGISNCLREILSRDDKDKMLVLSFIWNMAMASPDSSELPTLGIFECMAKLIRKGIKDKDWLGKDQNAYIPYYAAHIIGSYTMTKPEFAEVAVKSGVVIPLLELLRGKMSWVEQRVAVRALGHLASYNRTFGSVAAHEKEIVRSAMEIASTCLDVVYDEFLSVMNTDKRLKYHRDLLTRGFGGIEMENRKAQEWASQLQCWSLYILNCFACKGMSLDLICKKDFLRDLCGMWGGMVNSTSPAGVGLIRILCYSERGRAHIADSEEVIVSLCNLSRSSDDWQYVGIHCLILLLKDFSARHKVMKIVVFHCIDLVELKTVDGKCNLGDAITRALLLDFKPGKFRPIDGDIQRALKEIWDTKVERRKRERLMTVERIEERRVLVDLIKQQAKQLVQLGNVEGAIIQFTESLNLCPLKLRKERTVLYSLRSQCHLLLNNPDAAIRDSTRALCLSNPANSHGKSLWRRSQAYDMKGLAKESLMDCIMFLNGWMRNKEDGAKIPYHVVRMISKQMEATWLFAGARSRSLMKKNEELRKVVELECCDCSGSSSSNDEKVYDEIIMRMMVEKRGFLSGLSTIVEEPWTLKEGIMNKRESQRARLGRNGDVTVARSM